MHIHLIASLTSTGIIGYNGTLPWCIHDDLKHFKLLTVNSCVIMGRKTFESLNMSKGLSNRKNVVISSKAHKMSNDNGIVWVDSLDKAISVVYSFDEYYNDIFIIGGASIYQQAFDSALPDILDLSFVKKDYIGDTSFPTFDKTEWKEDYIHYYDEFTYIKYVKKKEYNK